MAPPLPYLLIYVKVIELEKMSLVIWKLIVMFLNIITCDGKYYLLNRDNLKQPIQM